MNIIFISKRFLYLIILIIGIIIVSCIFFCGRYKVKEVSYLPIANRIIGIDPGHGGIDPGAVSKNGIKEEDINLMIALKLKRFIEQSGGIVIMTRETDRGLYTDKSTTLREKKVEDLRNRKELIKESECEVFVSIHLNSFTQSKYYGAQTFHLLGDEESEKLAIIIQEELKSILDKDNNRQPVATEDIYLLNEVKVPSVLVECGFLSNSVEEKLLTTDEYQEEIAWSIYAGIMKYLSELTGKHKS